MPCCCDWEGVLPNLKSAIPELFSLGEYKPLERTGPGAWLRMVADGQVGADRGGLPPGTVPILYLPGVANSSLRTDLRAVKDDPQLAPIAELQYRGNFWRQENAKDWTLRAFFESKRNGSGLAPPRATNKSWQRSSRRCPSCSADCVSDVEPALAAVYRPWLQRFAESFQQRVAAEGYPARAIDAVPDGTVVAFFDGLRLDLARQLEATLQASGLSVDLQHRFTSVPSVTCLAGMCPSSSPLCSQTTLAW